MVFKDGALWSYQQDDVRFLKGDFNKYLAGVSEVQCDR